MRTPILALLIIASFSLQAQNKSDTSNRMGPVNVSVTDMKDHPKKGEQVIFRGEKNGLSFTGVSDAAGKIRQLLPPGDRYNVSIKSISDTTKYAVIDIPSLEPDEFFSEDFWVKIKFEPARSYRLDNVHFDTDKATLRLGSEDQLKDLYDYLFRHPDTRVEIAGHTDNTGTPAHNLQLSQNRANTIRDWLLKKGIKTTRIVPKGYGSNEPVASNNTEDGKQLNRRTEVRFLNTQ